MFLLWSEVLGELEIPGLKSLMGDRIDFGLPMSWKTELSPSCSKLNGFCVDRLYAWNVKELTIIEVQCKHCQE